MQNKQAWRDKAISYLDSIIAAPSQFSAPTWHQLEGLTNKSKVTLWRDKAIYNHYQLARQVKAEWKARTGGSKSQYRKTLEERIFTLENELKKANAIIDAHIVHYQQISDALQRLNIDPVLVMGELRSS